MIDSGELSATVAAVLGRRYRLSALDVKALGSL